MQANNHKKINIVLAIDIILYNFESWYHYLILTIGVILTSSFPDRIEQIGFKHRGLSHSLLLYTTLSLIVYWYIKNYYWMHVECTFLLGCLIGCLSHIVMDMFSKMGIKILGNPIRFNLYTTGNKSEYIFVWLLAILNFYFVYKLNYRR